MKRGLPYSKTAAPFLSNAKIPTASITEYEHAYAILHARCRYPRKQSNEQLSEAETRFNLENTTSSSNFCEEKYSFRENLR